MEDIFLKLEQEIKKKSADSEIAKYIISNLGDWKKINLATISKSCFTSPSTITRYAKKIGYSGFTEFKIYLVDYWKEIKLLEKSSDTVGETVASVNLEYIIDSLIKTNNLLKQNQIDKFYEKVSAAKKIYIFAQGGTYTIAYDLFIRLTRLNFDAQAINDSSLQSTIIRNSTHGDLFILISFSGNTYEIVSAANLLTYKKMEFITMTSNKPNEIKEKAWLSFEVPNESSQLRRMLNSSRIYLFFLVDSITTYIAIHLEGKGIGLNIK